MDRKKWENYILEMYFDLKSFKWHEIELSGYKKAFGPYTRSGFCYTQISQSEIIFFAGESEIFKENFDKNNLGMIVYHNDLVLLDLINLEFKLIYSDFSENGIFKNFD